MQINPKLIKNQFEKSMDKYNQNAVVQQITAEKLVAELAKIKKEFSLLESEMRMLVWNGSIC